MMIDVNCTSLFGGLCVYPCDLEKSNDVMEFDGTTFSEALQGDLFSPKALSKRKGSPIHHLEH